MVATTTTTVTATARGGLTNGVVGCWWVDYIDVLLNYSNCACSSGTSAGERKLMPTIEDELSRRQMLYSLLMPVMNLWVTHLSSSSSSFFN